MFVMLPPKRRKISIGTGKEADAGVKQVPALAVAAAIILLSRSNIVSFLRFKENINPEISWYILDLLNLLVSLLLG
jgi:hypothetical protein